MLCCPLAPGDRRRQALLVTLPPDGHRTGSWLPLDGHPPWLLVASQVG